MTKDEWKELYADIATRDPVDIKLEMAWKRGGKVKRSFMIALASLQWGVALIILAAVVAMASQ